MSSGEKPKLGSTLLGISGQTGLGGSVVDLPATVREVPEPGRTKDFNNDSNDFPPWRSGTEGLLNDWFVGVSIPDDQLVYLISHKEIQNQRC